MVSRSSIFRKMQKKVQAQGKENVVKRVGDKPYIGIKKILKKKFIKIGKKKGILNHQKTELKNHIQL